MLRSRPDRFGIAKRTVEKMGQTIGDQPPNVHRIFSRQIGRSCGCHQTGVEVARSRAPRKPSETKGGLPTSTKLSLSQG